MIFRFEQPYPADAVCVMAVGGNGDPTWSEVQGDLSRSLDTLEQYLDACRFPNYGWNDPLCNLAENKSVRWVIRQDVVAQNAWLKAIFDGADPVPAVAEGVLPLPADNPWLRDIQAGGFADAFRECAADCPHWVVPLVLPVPADAAGNGRPCQPLGFVLLDRPYPHHVDLPRQLPLTRLVCDLFAGLIAARAGRSGTPAAQPQPVAPQGVTPM
jgi:hypothetical protein